jgi:hypothetical protein
MFCWIARHDRVWRNISWHDLPRHCQRGRRGRLFFLLWLLYGTLCLLSNGRLLLIRPWQIEFFAFWIPLLCLYFSTRLANSDLEEPCSSGETTC